ncbi:MULTISPECIES: GGDEF domain-containing protein [unclassified Sphingomonas]|uniref:GGDEF domain-containing protein n=1 Tax=unclassified Sphingomonas TaxID=196159 RepID=UPI000A49FACF|nr:MULTISPECIES: sensor domain-containing diguanylate cyclase [unclassified Sphingomonas]
MPPALARLIETFDHAAAMVALYDPAGRILFANPSYRRAFFLDPDETPDWIDLMRRNHAHRRGPVVSHDDFEAWLSSSLSRRGKVPMLSIETDMHDGSWLHIVEQTMPDGHILFVALDITRMRQSERVLRQERDIALKSASTDPLTGISNRGHIMALMGDRIERRRAIPPRSTVAVLVDLDHFKRVNDRFGHVGGDQVLREFARIVRADLRTCDGFGRIGGEEFLILFPGMTIAKACRAVDRLRARISDHMVIPEDAAFRIDFSAGLTDVRIGDTVSSVYSRVDRALYFAKSEGRGTLRLAS